MADAGSARGNAWLWGRESLSDVTLLVVAAPDCEGGQPAQQQAGAEACKPEDASPVQVIASLALHSVVIGGASPEYFRRHILRLAGDPSLSLALPGTSARSGLSLTSAQTAEPALASATADSASADSADTDSMQQDPPEGPRSSPHQGSPLKRPRSRHSSTSASSHSLPALSPSPLLGCACSGQGPQRHVLRVVCHPGEPQGVPQAVLCHVYTGELPDDPETLVWMVWRADYLDLAATVDACLTKLQSLAASTQLTLSHATLLSSLPPLQTSHSDNLSRSHNQPSISQTSTSDTSHSQASHSSQHSECQNSHSSHGQAAEPRIQQLIDSALTSQLPVAHRVVTDSTLLSQFIQLLLPLVKRWVGLDELWLDSGNTLAVLFSAWYDAQPATPTDEQCKELSAMVPLTTLSLSFHIQAVPCLAWWRAPGGLPPTTSVMHVLTTLHASNATLKGWWEGKANAGGAGAAAAAARAPHPASHTWEVPCDKLRQLWRDRNVLVPNAAAFGGYLFHPRLTLEPSARPADAAAAVAAAGTRVTLRLRCDISWPDALLAHGELADRCSRPAAGLSLRACVTHSAAGAPEPLRTKVLEGSLWETGWGWSDIFACDFQVETDLVPDPGAKLTMEITCKEVH